MDKQTIIREQKMRFSKKYIIIIILLVIAISSFILFIKLKPFQKEKPIQVSSCQDTIYGEDFTIKLISRQFLPEAEISSGIKWLREYPGERVHVLLQLCEPTNPSIKTLFEKSGIQLLNYIPENSWFASIPKDLAKDNPILSMIRWFGPIFPEDKIHPSVLEENVSWALRDGNKIALGISFFEDVSLQDAEMIIKNLDGEVTGSTPISNELTIEISRDSVQLLAKTDSVLWIDVVPPPPVTNIER